MIKYIALGFLSLCLFNIAAYASDKASTERHKDELGFGLGAIIGGLLGGPPGAIIGAAGGAFFGEQENKEDEQMVLLEKEVQDRNIELAMVRNQFTELQETYGKELQQVMLQRKDDGLADLSEGVSMSVYFRTNSSEPDAEIALQLERLGQFLVNKPEINLQLNAHADRRGSISFNKKLSEKRATTVKNILIKSGLEPNRIYSRAFGEGEALAADGDSEGYVFDRRVDIELTLDTQI